MKIYLSRLVVCSVLVALTLGCHEKTSEPYVDAAAPLFELVSLDGEAVSLESLRGHPTVIHFGTSWCPFCRAEDPNLEALYNRYKEKGVNVLVVNVKEEEAKARQWYDEAGFSFPMLLDRDGQIAAKYAPRDAQPDLPRSDVMIASNLIVDRHGVVRFFSLLDTGSFDAKLVVLSKRLDEILEEQS